MDESADIHETKRLYVEKIKNGTVIDHIKSGFAFTVMKILNLEGTDGKLITVGINVHSMRSNNQKKDIIKVEGFTLEKRQIDQIALISPNSTVSYIEDYHVREKSNLKLPSLIKGILKCPNEKCITNVDREPVATQFTVVTEDPLKLTCVYCERIVFRDEMMRTSFK